MPILRCHHLIDRLRHTIHSISTTRSSSSTSTSSSSTSNTFIMRIHITTRHRRSCSRHSSNTIRRPIGGQHGLPIIGSSTTTSHGRSRIRSRIRSCIRSHRHLVGVCNVQRRAATRCQRRPAAEQRPLCWRQRRPHLDRDRRQQSRQRRRRRDPHVSER